ncbi:phosphoribosylanthranilate isomerase [candidate division KSB1 bacterium]
MTNIKICGITTIDDALQIADLGVDALGFIFYPKSKRYIAPEKAQEIIKHLPPFVSTVGVFVNENNVNDILHKCSLDFLQFHGDESPEYCAEFKKRIIKAFRVSEDFLCSKMADYSVNAFLLDSFAKEHYGGTGTVFDWDKAVEAKQYGKIILSGGLNPENISDALKTVKPHGVDISSGVEIESGIKDIKKVKQIVQICRNI